MLGTGAFLLGGSGALYSIVDAAHHRPGGEVGIAICLLMTFVGLGAAAWAIGVHSRIADTELAELGARGLDDGLPLGAFREGDRIGLQASDLLLLTAVAMTGFGLVFLVTGAADSRIGWRFGAAFSMIFFIPALAFLRLGTGTRYWLTPEGIETRRRRLSVRWQDVDRISPMHRGSFTNPGEPVDAFELHRPDSARTAWRRWTAYDFRIKLVLIELDERESLAVIASALVGDPALQGLAGRQGGDEGAQHREYGVHLGVVDHLAESGVQVLLDPADGPRGLGAGAGEGEQGDATVGGIGSGVDESLARQRAHQSARAAALADEAVADLAHGQRPARVAQDGEGLGL